MPQAGWRSSNILVDTSHMSIRSQKKCRNMFEGVDIVWYCGYLISLSSGQKLCGRLFARCFTPAGKFSGLQTRRKCITYYILSYYRQCIIHVWRSMKTVSLSKMLQHWQNSTKSYKVYLYSRGGTSNAFKVFCSELTDLCRCNGLTVLAQALAKQQNYAKTSISAQDFLCAVGSDFAHRYWHFGFPHAVPCVCILLGFWTGWGDIGREINDGHWNRNQWCQYIKELCASLSLTQHCCWLRGNL